jgi:hypothetical protein
VEAEVLKRVHEHKAIQLLIGLIIGILFGFLLQKGGVTYYDVIIGQLLLRDFTVVKVMLSAVVAGMIGVHLLRGLGVARLHPKRGSVGSSVVGGLIFGAGFGMLGYCPGTAAGAVGQGALDALFGGVVGIIIGAGLFAAAYPRLQQGILRRGYFGDIALPDLLRVNCWAVVLPCAALLAVVLWLLEVSGL